MLRLTSETIDDTVKPAIEVIDGRAVQKPMPTDLHALLSGLFWHALFTWAKSAAPGRGMVGVEWRFNVPLNSFRTESVAPDIAYLSTYADLAAAQRRYPTIPPDIAVEIRSPGDDESDIGKKRDFYLWWGVKLVIIADQERQTVETHEQHGVVSHLTKSDTLRSLAFPTLEIRLDEMFAEIDAFEEPLP